MHSVTTKFSHEPDTSARASELPERPQSVVAAVVVGQKNTPADHRHRTQNARDIARSHEGVWCGVMQVTAVVVPSHLHCHLLATVTLSIVLL